jgi:hypothetical protein
MLKNQPCFQLTIDTETCAYEVRLNDVPVMEHRRGSVMTVEVPINLYLFSGENVLELRVGPPPNSKDFRDEAGCEACVKVRPKAGPNDPPVQVAAIKFSVQAAKLGNGFAMSPPGGRFASESRFAKDDQGDALIGEVGPVAPTPPYRFAAARRFAMPLPFPQWIWKVSEPVADNAHTSAALLSEYRRFWSLANDRQAQEALEMCRQNIEDVAAGFYVTRVEAEDLLELGDMITSDELALEPLRESDLKLEVFGFGHLARLVDRKGRSPVAFRELDGSAVHFVPMMFCKTASGWQIVR